MANETRVGCLTTWFGSRGFGFITTKEGNVPVKFYFHISQLVSGAPVIGASVRFSVNPVREGRLLSAINVEVLLAIDEAESTAVQE